MKKIIAAAAAACLIIFFASACAPQQQEADTQGFVSLEDAENEQPLPPETELNIAGSINIADTAGIKVRFHSPDGLEPVAVSQEDGVKIAELLNGHELTGEWPALDPDPETMLSLYLDGTEHEIEASESVLIMNDEGSTVLKEGVIAQLTEILDNYR